MSTKIFTVRTRRGADIHIIADYTQIEGSFLQLVRDNRIVAQFCKPDLVVDNETEYGNAPE